MRKSWRTDRARGVTWEERAQRMVRRAVTRAGWWSAAGLVAGLAACGEAPLPPPPTQDAGPADTGPTCDADTRTSEQHCGACGNACAEGEVCRGSRCDTRPWIETYGNCDGTPDLCRGQCAGVAGAPGRMCAPGCGWGPPYNCPAPNDPSVTAVPTCQLTSGLCALACDADEQCPVGQRCRPVHAGDPTGVCVP